MLPTTSSGRTAVIFICLLTFLFTAGLLQAGEGKQGQAEPDHYIIGKGDVLEIVVWKEEELSREAKVRVDGRISLPLVDDVMAAGKTPMELKEVIYENMSRFIEGPEVTVIVQNQVSKAYYILGEVAANGEYPLEKELTLLQALAKAQGLSEWADEDDILLLRRTDNGGEKRIRIDYDDIVSGKTPEQNLMLEPGDTLVVPD